MPQKAVRSNNTSLLSKIIRPRSKVTKVFSMLVVAGLVGSIGVTLLDQSRAATLTERSFGSLGMPKGQCLNAGQYFKNSLSDYNTLTMQPDGNLVLTSQSGGVKWHAGTANKGGNRVCLQTDGNFVMYTASNTAVWQTYTSGLPANYVSLSITPNAVVLVSGVADYHTSFWTSLKRNTILSHEVIPRNSSLYSTNSLYRLTMQNDGNFVLYTNQGKALWASGSGGKGGAYAGFNSNDGIVRVYNKSRVSVWQNTTKIFYGTDYAKRLVVQDDGNVVLYSNLGKPVWNTATAGKY
jgi:hypothetical protein